MRKQIIGGAGVVVLGLAFGGAARAQPVYVAPGYGAPGYAAPGYVDPALPPYEIMSIVRSTGLRPLSRPMRRGPNYVLVAMDRAGRQMQVVVDARLGDIVNLHPAFAAAPYGGAPYGSNPYAAAPYGSVPYGAQPNGQAMPPTGGAAVIGSAPSQGIPSTSVVSSPRTVSGSRGATDGAPTSATRSVPSTKTANTPSGTVEIPDPPAPPLPRPRPKLAANESGAGSQTAPSATVGAKSTASAPAQQDSAPIE